MKVRLLGTGASDGIPAFFADCEVSRYARKHGGKDVRTRSAALVDGVLKIDLPPDTLIQLNRDGLDARDWIALFLTHSHDDHFALGEIQYALHPFTEDEFCPFVIYGNDHICRRLAAQYPDWPIEVVRTCSFSPVEVAGYRVTPIRAHHKLDEDSQNLIVQDGRSSVLYATDTGVWLEETWEFLASFRLDALAIECTEGFAPTSYYGHLDIDECRAVVGRLREMGVLKDGAHVVTTHHSALGGATHAQLEAALADFGVVPGFDGHEFEV